jgi:cyclopropane-fatty-acyl-phospholipid synthase
MLAPQAGSTDGESCPELPDRYSTEIVAEDRPRTRKPDGVARKPIDAPPPARAFIRLLEAAGASCELRLPAGETVKIGAGPPSFRVTLCNERALRVPLDEFSLGQAYVQGDIDLEGDILALLDVRDRLLDHSPLSARLRFLAQLFLNPPALVNRRAIGYHYTLGDDFYLSFIDRAYRFYSHCVFHSDEDTLEEAAEHKLESMWNALNLKPGQRLLDIGGGWGGVTEYCGARGVHVTSLTLIEDSANYIRNLIRRKNVTGEVILQDVLDHRPIEPYDHAVIYGVIEHIPNYRLFCRRVWDSLKPSGRLYLDASATVEKYDMSAFTRHYIWHGTHTFLALQDMIEELLFHGFEIVGVKRETRDYELTIRCWAQRLDAHHDQIAARWGEARWRSFRVYLWGGAHAFRTNRLQAYHLVAEKRAHPGPRPGNWRRFKHFLRSLR